MKSVLTLLMIGKGLHQNLAITRVMLLKIRMSDYHFNANAQRSAKLFILNVNQLLYFEVVIFLVLSNSTNLLD